MRPELLDILDDLAKVFTIVPIASLETLLPRCEESLRDAVPSRNGSVRDAHVLALARSVDADLWTTDRDFAGTGVAAWSTPNLMPCGGRCDLVVIPWPADTDMTTARWRDPT
jgi:PIN domain-containing protein